MGLKLNKLFRTIQVQFPRLQDAKIAFQKSYRRVFNKTHEEDFELLTYFVSRPSDTFVDIGANRGDAIQSILLKKPTAKVVAFEPNQLLVQKINQEFKGDTRVTIHNCGLGCEKSTSPLFVPFYNSYMFDGLASFKRENAESWLKNRLYLFKEKKLEVKEMQCKVEPLDSFNLVPKFLKIDVQGFEYEVLIGGLKTIKSHRPIILMEAPKERELKLLSDLSFEPFVFKNGLMSKGTNNYNVFLFPIEKIHEIAPVLAASRAGV